MKLIYVNLLLCLSLKFTAQEQLKTAIIKAKLESSNDASNESNGEGMQIQIPNNETTILVQIKDSMNKTRVENNFMINTIIRNTSSEVTTVLTESQGEKTGYSTTKADREDQKRRADSIAKEQQNNQNQNPMGGMMIRTVRAGVRTVKSIAYMEESKLINGINCKKAIASIVNNQGVEEKIEVWYSPDYVLPKGVNIGTAASLTFTNLAGIPIQYTTTNKINLGDKEITISNLFTVTEIDTKATVEDKEFKIPKGYKIKTYAEWIKDNPGGAMMQQRIIRM